MNPNCSGILFLFLINWFTTPFAWSQDSLVDFDGNSYPVIRLGSQFWMGKNLKVAHSADGEDILSYCFLNDSQNCNQYGRLYAWENAMRTKETGSGQGICPTGWHLPTDDEWNVLADFIGGPDLAGKKLREDSTLAFFAKCGGNYLPGQNIFSYLDEQAYFWTATQYSQHTAWMRNIGYRNRNLNRSTVPKEYCFSIRCIKN